MRLIGETFADEINGENGRKMMNALPCGSAFFIAKKGKDSICHACFVLLTYKGKEEV